MAADLSPQEIVDKILKNAAGAVGDYKRGVLGTKKNPMALAKAAKEKMRQGINQALDDGTWEDGLDAVSVSDWKKLTAEKGGSRYLEGLKAAAPKMLEFQTQFKPARDAVKAMVDSMPDNTFEERLQRMTANAMGLHEFRFKRRRSGG